MSVGAKRGSEIRYAKYPAVIPAFYVQWVLRDPKVPLEYIIIRLQKHVVDKYDVTNFMGDNNRREKNNTYIVDYRLTAYRKNLVSKSKALIDSIPIPKKEVEYITSNFCEEGLCQKWLVNKFFKNRQFKNALSNCQIITSYKRGEFESKKDTNRGLQSETR